MIFVLHYLLFNAGLPTVIILITLFLQTYSDASLSEIGTLLMALPFVGILIKPLFGALADRHQAHRFYLMGSLGVMALGYGSLAIAPFFPEFVQGHGRLVWYLDVLGIFVGYSAFGIVWSLGDALAVNGAQMANTAWGYYRMWGVVSWGLAGIVVGQVNELPFLPKFVPAFFVLVACLLVEIVLLAFWPNEYFIMGGSLSNTGPNGAAEAPALSEKPNEKQAESNGTARSVRASYQTDQEFADWPNNRSLTGTLKGTGTLNGTLSAKMMGAVANILMDDLGGSLKSSLRLSSKSRRKSLKEILDEHQDKVTASAAATTTCESPAQTRARGPSLELAVRGTGEHAPMDSPASARRLKFANHETVDELPSDEGRREAASSDDLQLVLLKLLIMRDKTIGKFLVLFTIFGFLLTCHLSYFYMHVEHLCREKGHDFASVMGGMLATHSISEMLAFIFVPAYINRVGRVGALLTCSLAYFLRFAYYGSYFIENSPYTGIPFEFCHGIAYGIVYTLITDIACECVNRIDEFLPELIERKLVKPDAQLGQLKSALRATMQGVFSGAFDGLGNGLGALFGGIFLDSYPFINLWQACAIVSMAVMVIYPITEWHSRRSSSERRPQQQQNSNLPANCAIDVAGSKEKPEKMADGAR